MALPYTKTIIYIYEINSITIWKQEKAVTRQLQELSW